MRKPSPRRGSSHQPLPWKNMLLGVMVLFLTGLMYLMQQFGAYFMGSIVGQPSTLLSGYACPSSNVSFEVSPIPGLFSYSKGNSEANRKEMLRINKKNHGLTSWYSYDKGFDEAAKAQLIDILAYEKNANQWVTRLYNAIKGDGSPHGSVDFVTKWLSPDNHNLSTVYPYASGLVVDVVEGHSGYGNYVSVCTDVVDAAGKSLRVLYSVAHLETTSVTEGQSISAGAELGKIGSTGNSTTPHAHITIHPDLVWVQNYKEVYNAGYNFYYSTGMEETLVKTIDPIAVMVNPGLAYSIVMDDAKRQLLFENAPQYVANLSNAVVYAGDLLLDSTTASILDIPSAVFRDFRIQVSSDQVKTGDQVSVTVEAVDQDGELYTDFSEDINVVLSSSTAQFSGVEKMRGGQTTFEVTDSVPGELIIQVSNQGTISEEKKVTFSDRLQFLEVTAPQKTSIGNSVTVALRPVGTRGGVIVDQFQVAATVFPAVNAQQMLTVDDGRGEYVFSADQQGIYELQFTADTGVTEKILITVEQTVVDEVSEEVVEETSSSEAEGVEDSELSSNENEKDLEGSGVSSPSGEGQGEAGGAEETLTASQSDIQFLEGDQYRIYTIDGATVMVFNDREVSSEFPVEMRFTVPDGTEAVSIFTGLNDRNFPDTGELKLSKYSPGQEFIRYYPKYVPEDAYKKVVAYKGREVLAERIFTWSPASVHAFTDVVEGVTDPEIYAAVKALKEAGVVKGNPDGSYGVDTPINRAATATILIRAFYTDVNLETLQVSDVPFSDVPAGAWYESAMWFASQDEFEGESKPVIIKGFEGKANPDGNVKIEEFVTMILRLLEVNVEVTEPWYEGPISKAIQLNVMTEKERELIDQPLSRGMVARMMVKALQLAEEIIDEQPLEGDFHDVAETEPDAPEAGLEEESSDDDVTEGPVEDPVTEEEPVEDPVADEEPVAGGDPVAAYDITYRFRADAGLSLQWESDYTGEFRVYRETIGGRGEVIIGETFGTSFTDDSAEAGNQYYYRIEFDQAGVERVEVIVNL